MSGNDMRRSDVTRSSRRDDWFGSPY